jgi:hypothetical protein
VIGDEHVVEMFGVLDRHVAFAGNKARQHADTRLSELPADQARQRVPHDPRDHCEDQVQRTDVLVVGGKQPTREETRLVVVIVVGVVEGDFIHRHGTYSSLSVYSVTAANLVAGSMEAMFCTEAAAAS